MEFKDQIGLFRWVWENRAHYSEVSGKPLGEDMNVCFFAHCLPKGSYGLYKLKPFNIILMTFHEHMLYDHQTHKAKTDARFNWVFQYRELLTERYNRISNIKMFRP